MDYRGVAKQLPWARGVNVLACDDNGLIAIEKPSGVLSHPNKKADKERSILEAPYDEKEQFYQIPASAGAVGLEVYLLNRLDSATSGIVLLALEAEVARSVLQAFESKRVKKIYSALVFGMPRGGSPVWRDRLTVKKSAGTVRAQSGSGVVAETQLVRVEPLPGVPLMSRLTLMPITGRTHQLRIQTSKRGIPIVGDRTYGDFQKNKQLAKSKGVKRLCLHCASTELEYRLAGRSWRFKAHSEAPF